jgi:hypothetical protein
MLIIMKLNVFFKKGVFHAALLIFTILLSGYDFNRGGRPGPLIAAEPKIDFIDATDNYRGIFRSAQGLIIVLYYDSENYSEDCDASIDIFVRVLGHNAGSRYRVDIRKFLKEKKFSEIEHISRKEIGEKYPGKIITPALVWYFRGAAVADYTGYMTKGRLKQVGETAARFRKLFIENGYIKKID